MTTTKRESEEYSVCALLLKVSSSIYSLLYVIDAGLTNDKESPHFGKLFCSYSQLCHSNISFHFCQILALRHSFSIAIILDVLKNAHTNDSD